MSTGAAFRTMRSSKKNGFDQPDKLSESVDQGFVARAQGVFQCAYYLFRGLFGILGRPGVQPDLGGLYPIRREHAGRARQNDVNRVYDRNQRATSILLLY